MDYLVLLYYCYAPIDDVDVFREEHHRLCLRLHLRGRIIVAPEGLNGTVSGRRVDCEEYMRVVKADPRFAALEFKIEPADAHTFQKLHVRVKPEIVHVGLPDIKPYERTGIHLSPQEFKDMKDQEDVVVLDVRSDYEHELGRFKNAVTLDIENFREFPGKVEELAQYKDKKILTYCTGGIKCEKASAFLLEQGFENVYQLHGGIIKYGLEAGGEDFDGKCYVFDGRVAVDVNSVNPTIISTCHHCHTPSARMVNCANPHCNDHLPLCETCAEQLEGACSPTCQQHPDKRPYDGTGTYPKNSNNYNPEQGLLSYRAPAK
ncbi:rhodanese-related sulfurtransferase [Hymenobacter defluvii]|uniref:tRNA uridine(34) hydroxylase n=1 Tax=Hymenobacter defluvii TaxID=2054411 RepID=A0ABS3T758_9BACT|nr:rhodanese-related sulfurtransferase [Hymenobacter defluvii]MBO3269480.1 rhodanese-related sulfurtransferase [Hymenobacter defluvii]